jgi:hypothetical protein
MTNKKTSSNNGNCGLRVGGCPTLLQKTQRVGHPALTWRGLEVPGDVDYYYSLVAFEQEEEFEELDALVVEGVLPPMADD